MRYQFSKSDVSKESRFNDGFTFGIKINGPCRQHVEAVEVESLETGRVLTFEYDKARTYEQYEINEGWDGEQDVSIFVNHDVDTILYVWQTPYDVF